MPLLPLPDLLSLSNVSTRFNFVVETAPNWRSLTFSPAPASGIGLARLLERQHAVVESLTAHKLAAAPLQAAAPPLKRLTALDISGSVGLAGDDVVHLVRTHATTLTRLTLDGVTSLTDANMAALAACAGALRHLSLAGCRQLSNATLASLASSGVLARLHSLVLAGCEAMTGAALAAALETACTPAIPAAAAAGADATVGSPAAAAAAAAAAADAPPPARSTLPLRHLDCRGIHAVSDVLLDAACAAAPLLTHLDVGSANPFAFITSAAVAASARAGGRRSSVASSTGGRSRAGTGASAVAAEGGLVVDVDAPLSPHYVSDAGIRLLAAYAPHLHAVRLQGHAAVSDDALATLFGRLTGVKAVDLRGCKGVGAHTVAAVAACAPTLTELRLFGCSGVDDAALAALTPCTRLVLLDLYGCRRLTLPAITAVAGALAGTPASPGALTTLYCGGIPAVRDALAAVADASFATFAATAAAVATHAALPTPEPHVQLSALFPAHLDVRMY